MARAPPSTSITWKAPSGASPEDATPFPDRVARYWLNIYGFWPDAADDAARTAFVRGFAADMEPHASGGQYVNFLGQEGPAPTPRAAALAVYGPDEAGRGSRPSSAATTRTTSSA